ncbi:MAG TPA: hypothetical protein VK907_10300, partial [Phnomibacter sp.]|nr:hypothetical protein [Phnomibacter sp.]
KGLNIQIHIFSKFNPYRVAIDVAFITTNFIGGYSGYTPPGYFLMGRLKHPKYGTKSESQA